jgi:hypothetical protein
MPIAAAAFVVSTAQLAKLGALAAADDVDGFWELLHREAKRVVPEFPHSGYVVSVLLEYLEERGLHIVSVDPGPEADRIADAALGLQFCLTRTESARSVEALEGFRATEGEFLTYYEEFADEPLAHAGGAMLDGLEYLKRALGALSSDEDHVLLFVG